MAEANVNVESSESDGQYKQEMFHDIDNSKDQNPPPASHLSLLMKMTQSAGKVLPVGVITERSVFALVKQATGVVPLGVTVMNDRDVLIEFRPKVRLREISSQLHHIHTWGQYAVEFSCLMSTKPQLVKEVHDREKGRKAESEFE